MVKILPLHVQDTVLQGTPQDHHRAMILHISAKRMLKTVLPLFSFFLRLFVQSIRPTSDRKTMYGFFHENLLIIS